MAVVLQPNDGIDLTIILDDVAWHSKMLWEARVTHGAFERFRPRSFGAKAASLVIVTASTMWVPRVVLGLCIFIPLVILVVHIGF
jgi:hypothetical protein